MTARESEADLRAADLEVFRAMLVDQESSVKEITAEAKVCCKSLAESANASGLLVDSCAFAVLAQ